MIDKPSDRTSHLGDSPNRKMQKRTRYLLCFQTSIPFCPPVRNQRPPLRAIEDRLAIVASNAVKGRRGDWYFGSAGTVRGSELDADRLTVGEAEPRVPAGAGRLASVRPAPVRGRHRANALKLPIPLWPLAHGRV